ETRGPPRRSAARVDTREVKQSLGRFVVGGVAVLFVVSSFVSFTQKVPAALDELSLIRSGKPVVGTVVGGDLSNSEGGSSDQPMVSYRYTVHGKEHEGRYTDQQVLERSLEAGSAVKLEYSSDRPSLSRPAGTGR